MAQQIFDQYAPLAKVSASETIPVVAAIAQTRDGKDELLHGIVPFVPAGGLYVPVSAANRLPVEAALSGRNAVEHILFNAVEIRTNQDILSPTVDLTPYREWHLLARTTLDQPVVLKPQFGTTASGPFVPEHSAYWTGNTFASAIGYVTIPTSIGAARVFIVPKPWGDNFKPARFRVVVQCNQAPTTGAFSMVLLGVPN